MVRNIHKCSSKDYDYYKIQLPLSVVFGKKRKRFIYGELGKIHPCFCDDWIFDSKLCLNKNKFFADVLVMQKLKLAEYKQFNQKIVIEETGQRKYFRSNKDFILLCFLIFLSVVIGAVTFFIYEKKNIKTENVQSEIVISNEKKSKYSASGDVVEKVFKQVNDSLGKISSFEWKTDGYNEIFTAEIKNIYPETLDCVLEKGSFSPVTFEKDIPRFSFNVVEIVDSSNVKEIEVSLESKEKVRENLFADGFVLKEEKVNPYAIRFDWKKNDLDDGFCQFLHFILDEKMNVSKISIQIDKKEINENEMFLSGEIEFSNFYSEGTKKVLENIITYWNIFYEKTDITPNIISAIEKKITNLESEDSLKDFVINEANNLNIHTNNQESKIGKKIGQIIKSDGLVIYFFKDDKGKIKKIEEGENQENEN